MARKHRYENLSETPQFAPGFTMLDAIRARRHQPADVSPKEPVSFIKSDLKNLKGDGPLWIWFGHSSYLIHFKGLNFLIDPVLSGSASPVNWLIRAFEGSDSYKAADMPPIDYLILTHNHYDHLDFPTLKKLAPQIKQFIVPERVSRDLPRLPDTTKVVEMAWGNSLLLREGNEISCTPARHFSGRGLVRNPSLWASYVLNLQGFKLFIGGDSGYDFHFKEISKQHGSLDVAFLECGQYNEMWPYIHSFPEEVVQEGLDLAAKLTIPVHWGKFALANHSWREPVERFEVAAKAAGVNYHIPTIGEVVNLGLMY